jgi:hypothetical protein
MAARGDLLQAHVEGHPFFPGEKPVWVFPEVAGSGDRLLEGLRASLQLVDTTRFGAGIVVLKLAPT